MSYNKLIQGINQFANWLADKTTETNFERKIIRFQSSRVSKSPDSPIKQKSDDYLNRWHFAQNVYRIIKSTPEEWSKRIGIFGAWGEGKTTALEFISSQVKEDGDIVVWFNPWEVQNREELWTTFAVSVYDAIENEGLEIPSYLKHKIRKIAQFVKPFDHSINYLKGFDKRAENIIGLMNSPLKYWLSPNHGELSNIPEIIKKKKIVVFIDDLDRANPEIVPHLLLSLQELLDLSFMVFILAFDPNVIKKAIKIYNPGWEKGPEFIDKIIDFQYWLPDVEEEHKLALISSQIEKHFDFLDLRSFENILAMLPDNPRKLKKYLRHLIYLKPEVIRHDKEELRWPIIIIFQLLKFYFPVLYRNILENENLLYHLSSLQIIDRNSDDGKKSYEKNIKAISDELSDICKKFDVDEIEKEKIVKILKAIGDRSFFHPREMLYYQAMIVEKPHALTWKEFHQFYKTWLQDQMPKTIAKWLSKHSLLRAEDRKRVLSEAFDTSIKYRLALLEEASDKNCLNILRAKTEEADNVLVLLSQFLYDLSDFTVNYSLINLEKFENLLNMVEKWIHFTNHSAYIKARENEKAFLIKFVTGAPHLASEIYILLEPWDPRGFHGDGTESIISLRSELASIAQEYIAADIIDRFSQQEGIHELWGHDQMLAQKYLLFRLESPVWQEERKTKYFELAKAARDNDVIRENFIEFVRMLSHYSQEGFNILNPKELKSLASNVEIVKAAWDAALSNPLQPHAMGSFERHQKILGKFISEDNLIFPEIRPESA